MDNKNKKIIKILSSLIILSLESAGIYAIPNDPNSFYGDVKVDGKIISDSKLIYYQNNINKGEKQIKNSQYGLKFDKVVFTGLNGDNLKFELDSNSINCATATSTIEYIYVGGEVKKLNLDFTGTNTCNDEPETETPNNGGGSSGGSGGGSSGGSSTPTMSQEEMPVNETIEPEIITNVDTSTKNSGSNFRTNSLIQTTQSEASGDVEDIEVITTDSSNTIKSNLEIKKEKIETGLSGNIIAGNKSLVGLLALVLCLTGFIGWRENKKRKLKNAAIIAGAAATSKQTEKSAETEILDSPDSKIKKED
jgi:hypothetical protein